MSDNLYETPKLVGEYLLFHYGKPHEILPPEAPDGMAAALDFAVRTQARFAASEVERGLDLGCAVGRSAYEMTTHCREVIGIDFSRAFIDAARALSHGPVAYKRLDEAHLTTPLEASVPTHVQPDRVHFETGDAMDLRADLGEFDRVHAANLLCRLTHPRRLLERLPGLIRPDGELILTTPCTWLGEFTPPENWPAGPTLDWLKSSLDPHFSLEATHDEPFLIRETARKFQWTRAQLSYWKRRS